MAAQIVEDDNHIMHRLETRTVNDVAPRLYVTQQSIIDNLQPRHCSCSHQQKEREGEGPVGVELN